MRCIELNFVNSDMRAVLAVERVRGSGEREPGAFGRDGRSVRRPQHEQRHFRYDGLRDDAYEFRSGSQCDPAHERRSRIAAPALPEHADESRD